MTVPQPTAVRPRPATAVSQSKLTLSHLSSLTRIPISPAALKFFSLTALLAFALSSEVSAQLVSPVTRFFPSRGKYDFYDDNLLSGFLQRAPRTGSGGGGFLQLGVTGDPLLVYVGEKDSTQFTAYASAYCFGLRDEARDRFVVALPRYGVTMHVAEEGDRLRQVCYYPDTTATKGFLVDIDQGDAPVAAAQREDMDVWLVDRQSLRARRRVLTAGGDAIVSAAYYYARFSRPIDTWTLRRERVTLASGQKVSRLKAALTFKLGAQDSLVVTSAVSARATDDAYALVSGHRPRQSFDDALPRRDLALAVPASADKASARPAGEGGGVTARGAARTAAPAARTATAEPFAQWLEVSTTDAALKTAFYAALTRLGKLPDLRKVRTGDELLRLLSRRYPAAADTITDVVRLDSLVRARSHSVFSAEGGAEAGRTEEQIWFVMNALGFRPEPGAEGSYRIGRPFFNVVTLQLPRGRRLTSFNKNNAPARPYVTGVTLRHQPLDEPYVLTPGLLMGGGILEIKTAARPTAGE